MVLKTGLVLVLHQVCSTIYGELAHLTITIDPSGDKP